ncbi:uncharacterized protein M6G45_013928 [Spheniscus humboldti]
MMLPLQKMPQHPGALTRSAKNVTAADACSCSPGSRSPLAAMLRKRGSWQGEKQRPLLRRWRNETRDLQATSEFSKPHQASPLAPGGSAWRGPKAIATSNARLPLSELPVPPVPLHRLAGVYRELIQLASRSETPGRRPRETRRDARAEMQQ